MKIFLAQTRSHPGDLLSNIAKHKAWVREAVAEGCDVVFFPELSLTGYEPRLANELAIYAEDSRLGEFQILSSHHQMTIAVGVPIRLESAIHIGMVLFQPRQGRQVYFKQYLHPDEMQFFTGGINRPTVQIGEMTMGLAICYELSVLEHAAIAHQQGAQIYVASVAKSKTGVSQAAQRLLEIAREYNMTTLMVNSVGPADNFIGAGASAVWDDRGNLIEHLDQEQEGYLVYDTVSGEATTSFARQAAQ